MRKVNYNNFFNLEKRRAMLASTKKYHELIKTYGSKFPEIKNSNTPVFWDNKLKTIQTLSEKDGMTNARIRCAFSFLPHTSIKVLDIGAGQGYLEELLEKRNELKMYANDFSIKGIQLLKKRFKGNFRVESIEHLKYPKGYFDTIFALEVLEHVPPHKIFLVLKSIREIIVKNGFLVISVPLNEHLDKMQQNPSGHLRDYKKELIIAELEIAGFKILEYKCYSAFSKNFKIKSILQRTILKNKWEYNDIIIKAQKI